MTTRPLPYLLLLPVVGVLVGSGLAGLASAPGNDPCFSSAYMQEGTSASSSLELWPLGLRCDYLVGTHLERSMFLGPTTAELYASGRWLSVMGCIVVRCAKRCSRRCRRSSAWRCRGRRRSWERIGR